LLASAMKAHAIRAHPYTSPYLYLRPVLTLLQIAKMLQNLANKPSYSKEQYMMSLNPFVENNKARMNKFLNSLCEVGDFYESLEVGETRASERASACEWHAGTGLGSVTFPDETSLTSTWRFQRRICRSTSP
jgi:hypothetical protein